MKILACHNYYQQPGGEDRCFEDECALLEKHGHTVVRYVRDNDQITGVNKLLTGGRVVWSQASYREARNLIKQHNIDVVHCTNSFPLISPSIYYAANRQGVPVVQTLQNYRLMCANSYFLRDNKVCENCMGKMIAFSAIRHACYRDSRVATAAVVAMQTIHRLLGTWNKMVDCFVVPTEFARSKFIEAGLPSARIVIKPNFVDPKPDVGYGQGGYALFAGRLSPEKGIDVLLSAWKGLAHDLPLWILGDGPLRPQVEEAAAHDPRIRYLGFKPGAEVLTIMREARFLVVPSLWYEGLPRTIVESLAVGTPIVVSKIGPLESLGRPEAGGFGFDVGQPTSLVSAIHQLLIEPDRLQMARRSARAEFERSYSAEGNYQSLMDIYAVATLNRNVRISGSRIRPSKAIPIPGAVISKPR